MISLVTSIIFTKSPASVKADHCVVIMTIAATNNIQYTYDEYYAKSYQQIEKFSITELCEKLDLPKETVRRKVLDLEKE